MKATELRNNISEGKDLDIQKLVIIKKKTWLEELIERFNTRAQAKFYIEHSGGSWGYYEDAHSQYYRALELFKKNIPKDLKFQIIEREFLPNFLFNKSDLIVPIGPDGLVINTAKYLDSQYIFAVNPDKERIDGILIPFEVTDIKDALRAINNGNEKVKKITMAKAKLNNGQNIHGVNDLFIGHQSHMSARYSLKFTGQKENQSSSGIIISTGCGSTGWFRSIVTGAIGIASSFREIKDQTRENDYRFNWNSDYLYFSVREPFESKLSKTNIIFGRITKTNPLIIESNMPENGVIFSDGIEKDFLDFNSGTIANISIADRKVNLLVKE